ncbi:hypothetical protein PR048_022454 [Dryococelus australis]|uniref:Uncharacterized protein n=1 Tax=Dryococelus australis TaxID=614101 RepID=A0ABQ9H151_9NEOP|nr:hypothetical protein PR048_022454 [Dryococelus australis]
MFSKTPTEQMGARICLEIIDTNLGFVAKQELAFRDYDSNSGIFFQLNNLRWEDSLELKQWMARNRETFSNGKILNEILGLSSDVMFYEMRTGTCSQRPPKFRDISGEEQLCFSRDEEDLRP